MLITIHWNWHVNRKKKEGEKSGVCAAPMPRRCQELMKNLKVEVLRKQTIVEWCLLAAVLPCCAAALALTPGINLFPSDVPVKPAWSMKGSNHASTFCRGTVDFQLFCQWLRWVGDGWGGLFVRSAVGVQPHQYLWLFVGISAIRGFTQRGKRPWKQRTQYVSITRTTDVHDRRIVPSTASGLYVTKLLPSNVLDSRDKHR